MPTERFYRLSDQKKQIIRNAVIKEFSRVPYEKTSINRIVRDADISRGSFYTYFSDKQDALDYILGEVQNQIKNLINQTLAENDGDYFDTWEQLLEAGFAMVADEQRFRLAKNTFASTLGSDGIWSLTQFHRQTLDSDMQEIMGKIKPEQLKVKQTGAFICLSNLLLLNLIKTLQLYYQGERDIKILKKIHKEGIEILKYGALSA